jgi:small-conductance mechanosensitive channel
MTTSVRMVVVALALRTALAQAQLPPAAPAPTTPPTPPPAVEETIPIAQIPDRAGQVDQELRTIRARLAGDELLAKLRPEIDAVDKQIAQVSSDFTRNVASGVTATGLNDIRSQWLQLRDLMTSWAGQLNVRAEAADRDLARLGELEGLWARTADATKGTDVGPAVFDTIAGTRAGIRDLQAKARAEREDVLEALARLSGLKADVADRVEELDQVEARFRADLLTFESPPLWDVVGRVGSVAAARQQAHTGIVRTVRLAQAFAKTQRPRMILHGLLTALLVTLAVRLSRRRAASGAEAHDDAMRALVAHPIVATAVLSLMLTFVLYPYVPGALGRVIAIVVALLSVRMSRGVADRLIRHTAYVIVGLLLVSVVRQLLPPEAPLGRLLLLGQAVVIAVWVGLLLQRLPTFTADWTPGWQRFARGTLRVVFVLALLAVVANVFGNVSLAAIITEGIVDSGLLGIILRTLGAILEALVDDFLDGTASALLRSVGRRRAGLEAAVARRMRIAVGVLWLVGTLWMVHVLVPAVAWLRKGLGAELQVGEVTLSLGSVLTVLVTVWLSVKVARLVRVVLEEDALPRMSLPRGVPAAISIAANYLVLLIGFGFALSAAGLDPGRVTLLAGALSVGIGFGLQTIVNNFVSGLILLFERPVQIGDVIAVGGVMGQVRRIGIRSSTIAVGDGAELIVPNADLISNQVLNYTLSSAQRRLEVKVGVAYGSDPTQVLTLLEQAAKSLPDILQSPSPLATFTGFGPSSLDFTLWGWTDRQDGAATVRSQLAIAVHDVLRNAGIAIPFPQVDVHVVSPPS